MNDRDAMMLALVVMLALGLLLGVGGTLLLVDRGDCQLQRLGQHPRLDRNMALPPPSIAPLVLAAQARVA